MLEVILIISRIIVIKLIYDIPILSLVFNQSFLLSTLIYLSYTLRLARVFILNFVLIILFYLILNEVPEDWIQLHLNVR